MPSPSFPVHVRHGGTSIVLAASPTGGLPRLAYWGDDLGPLMPTQAEALALATSPGVVSDSTDHAPEFSILPELSRSWYGTPGIVGDRDGEDYSPSFTDVAVEPSDHGVRVTAADAVARLALSWECEIEPSGLVRVEAEVGNEGDRPYRLEALTLLAPVPPRAVEVMDFEGRHLRERHPQRAPFDIGSRVRSSRKGRPSLQSTTLVIAGEAGFGDEQGEAWATHVAWSGNHTMLAERSHVGVRALGGGELLLPGEMILAPHETYRSPAVFFAHGHGLNAISAQFARHLRDQQGRAARPRPVTLNTWEAVYFEHDLDALVALADRAARVGVERFVLDDGWFGSRRNDSVGLGDWTVSPDVWPEGLHPLIDAVRERGMEFGLWVEPEMVSPDSELARAHPDWIMRLPERMPWTACHQQVLDLSHPAAYAHVLAALDALLDEYPIAYLKWDHNRDLLESGARPRVHEHTLAVYRLIDEIRARHPGLEIEACAGGGGRIDLGILARTDRVWVSDCNDPLERQTIQRGTALLVPPELRGQHIGTPTSHTTGRTHALAFRAGTALLGHLGIEWDLREAADDELAELAAWIDLHVRLRPLIAEGRELWADAGPDRTLTGIVSPTADRAVFVLAQTATSATYPAAPIRLAGLDADRTYRVTVLNPTSAPAHGSVPVPWTASPDGIVLPGRALLQEVLTAPSLLPESVMVLGLEALDR